MSQVDEFRLTDYTDRVVRLTNERGSHILKHPEMESQLELIQETLLEPELVIATWADESVRVYHRHYPQTPVSSKYLQVAVKILSDDAFVLTAFFSSRQKRGLTVWPE